MAEIDHHLLPFFITETLYLVEPVKATALVPTPDLVLDLGISGTLAQPSGSVLAAPAKPLPSSASAPVRPVGAPLPQVPARGLAVLVHQESDQLPPTLMDMLDKLAAATRWDTTLLSRHCGPMHTYGWPMRWERWPPRLTLLLGWPPALLARVSIGPNRLYEAHPFGAGHIIAAHAPDLLDANRTYKTQLWAAMKEVIK